jgi:hypothetical protein
MATIGKVTSKETKMFFKDTMPIEKLTATNIFLKERELVITDPIDPKRISKETTNCLNAKSVVKAVLVFAGTIGLYNLFKNRNIFSYFGWTTKNVSNNKIAKVTNGENSLNVRKNVETTMKTNNPPINQILQTSKIAKFKEKEIEEFKNLQEIKKEENLEKRRSSFRRSINIQNPIPNQNVTVGELFELTIEGNSVFTSNGTLFIETVNVPAWLNFSLLNPNPTFKGSYDTPSYARDVVVFGNYAYVADGYSGLQIIDVYNGPQKIDHYIC